jgi:hypothetical protein
VIDPVFTMLWLASLVVVAVGALRFGFRLVLGGWMMLEEGSQVPIAAGRGRPARRVMRRRPVIIPPRHEVVHRASGARLTRSI